MPEEGEAEAVVDAARGTAVIRTLMVYVRREIVRTTQFVLIQISACKKQHQNVLSSIRAQACVLTSYMFVECPSFRCRLRTLCDAEVLIYLGPFYQFYTFTVMVITVMMIISTRSHNLFNFTFI